MSSHQTKFEGFKEKEKPMLIEWLVKISDYGDVMLSKAVHHFGVWVGVGGGTAMYAAGNIVENSAPSWLHSILEYGGLVTMVAGVALIIKNLSDVVLSWTKAIWERRDKKENGDA